MNEFQQLSVAFSISERGIHSKHRIFCKKHSVRQNSQVTPNDKTLFTLGWPPYATEEAIKEMFSRAGHVTAVYFRASPGPVTSSNINGVSGFKVGYVVFSMETEVDAALRLCHAPVSISCLVSSDSVGVSKWVWQYLRGRPSADSLEKEAEAGVALYDRQQEEALEARLKAGLPDDEGWITVTRKTTRLPVST